ncbi:iron complex transport system permease protein [Mesorhizobium albiziae]|uniref:Iron complex transport system permease protein n=1 Tax=Neomesorhizobium albiziae TaxID=335020 RepID=A0A1I4DQJ7_9HYPH|nr:Fe(3+)-hydroxamate ABC transporter permease FhuB [Mesorhizobium albiziae]GLS31268.1 Fe3+-hydroxamate ABC transporter permease FhuB [Mesorhizobium albiziae]SFK94567.1 iron complex transport system permease protein [Mesorhizobium albiziae]
MAERHTIPSMLWGLMAAAALALFAWQVADAWPDSTATGIDADLQQIILDYTILPRAAVAILGGAALGLAGLLLQRVLRNPLAEPSTLGISAGAQLAMAAATIYAPSTMAWSQGAVAFAGGVLVVTIVLALTWRRGLEPVSVVLAGMMLALTCNAASAALILANGEYLFSLFIWGGGSLLQQSWGPATAITLPLCLGLGAAMLMLRPLSILGLDDSSARNLGVAPNVTRLLVVALAVWIATTVTAEVGVIGFVGLAAPALATLSGARTLQQRLVWAPIIGAILLWLTDGLVQLAAGQGGQRVPTGAATALLGGPLLLWLLPRLRMFEWPSLSTSAATIQRAKAPPFVLILSAVGVLAAAACALIVGRGPDGWSVATGSLLADLWGLRAPRVGVAAVAGAMLGAAGVVIQRMTGNPLASPEVLGVGGGAGAGLTAVIIFDITAGLGWQLFGSAIGASLALVAILATGARGNFGPERLLLAGVAMSALCSAMLTAVISLGNAQSYVLLRWLSGSTSDATMLQVWTALVLLCASCLPLLFLSRWLDILPLGSTAARSLGMPLRAARLVLVLLTAIITACATMFIGPLSFIGLIAPHVARLCGLTHARHHLIGSTLIGALVMVLSDWLARMVAFPYQLPVGLFASLISGPYLVYLLGKGVKRHG